MAPLSEDTMPPIRRSIQQPEPNDDIFKSYEYGNQGNETFPPKEDKNRAGFRRITVEPIIFCMMMCYGLLVPLKLQYLTERFSEQYNTTTHGAGADDEYCNQDSNHTHDDNDIDIERSIQQQTALWSMFLSAATALPGIFTTTLLGAYSDRAGRKIALVLPCAGFTAYAGVYLVVMGLELRLEYLFIAHFALGISGDFTLLLTGCFSYMADITTDKQRMFRIVILDVFAFIGAGISQIAVGFWIDFKGFFPPYLFVLSTVFLCTLYSICGIEDSLSQEKIAQKSQSSTVHAFVKFFQNNTNNRRWRIVLLLVILALRFIVFYSLSSITLLYGLGEPFCWNSIMVGYFSAGQYVIGVFGKLDLGWP